MSDRLVLLTTTHRVAPGLLSWPAWSALRAGPVLAGDADHPQLAPLAEAGIPVEVLSGSGPRERAAELVARVRYGGTLVWLAGEDGDPELARALGETAVRDGGVEIEVLYGSQDLPGARLLDVVAVVDRLRSPGGCPWDREQTHETLAKYLLEEAYEAYAAIEERDLDALREEIGDVLVQVALHARLAEEHEGEERFDVDDVAADLVAKLVRRHPHVFGTANAQTAAEVETNWQRLKHAEKSRASVTEGVPLAQPALALATQLQSRATEVGLPPELLVREVAAAETPEQAVSAAAAAVADTGPRIDAVGDLLFAAVTLARTYGVDPEAALRARSRRFRDRLGAIERDVVSAGRDPRELDYAEWHERWDASESEADDDRLVDDEPTAEELFARDEASGS